VFCSSCSKFCFDVSVFCSSCSNFRFDVSVFCASCSNFRFNVPVFCASCSNFRFNVPVFCAGCSNLRHVCSDVGCHITMKILNIAVPNCMEYRPNPQPLPFKGRGVRFKASLLKGERNGSEVKTLLHPSENHYRVVILLFF
jgi:hypothetical protein